MKSATLANNFLPQSTWHDQDSPPSPRFRVLRAQQLGMCFGVRDAIQLAQDRAKDGPLTVLGDLAHNPRVLRDLEAQGVQFRRDLDQVNTRRVMITAHGASERSIEMVRQRGFELTEATCPLVHYAHREVKRLAHGGYHPVIVGKRDHVEVRGLTGDLEDFDVILTPEDVNQLRPRARFGVAAQTTQPIDRVRSLVARIQERFPESEVRFADTVCQPTKLRQSSAIELARQCDAVVVVGGAHSNNTKELAQTCERHCSRVRHVQSARDLRPEWFAEAATVGLTAGTSTPDSLIDEVESRLRAIAEEKA